MFHNGRVFVCPVIFSLIRVHVLKILPPACAAKNIQKSKSVEIAVFLSKFQPFGYTAQALLFRYNGHAKHIVH